MGTVDGPTGHQVLRRLLAVLAVLQLLTGAVAAFTISAPQAVAVGQPSPRPADSSEPEPEPEPEIPYLDQAPVPVPGETDAADATSSVVNLYQAAGATKPFKALTNPTWEGVPLIMHVLEDKGDWLNVRVNTRPNGATAWIRRSDVAVRRVPNRIVIDVGDRRLTVLHGNDVLTEHEVGVGTPSTPTPLGDFYVDATVHLTKPSVYGVGQLSVSGFSEVHQRFAGGIGQIAIHGTNNPRDIGTAVSNGCIRMANAAWKLVAALAPNGTPVSIQA